MKNEIEASIKFDLLFKKMPNAIAYCKMLYNEQGEPSDLVYLSVNYAFEKLIGLSEDVILGNKESKIMLLQGQTGRKKLLKTCRQADYTRKVEKVQFYLKSLKIWLSIKVYSPQKDNFIAIFENINELIKVEKELTETKRDLVHAQTIAKIGNWRIILKSNELFWSDEAYKIFGVPKNINLTYQRFLSFVFPDDRTLVDKKWQAALKGERYDIEHRIIVDETIKWVRETADVEFSNGQLASAFGTVQDITEQVLLRKKLEDYTEHLEKLVKKRTNQLQNSERLATIGQIAAMVGHDIRTPLQAINSNIYLIRDYTSSIIKGEMKNDIVESLDDIENNVGYITEIVADLQDYARPLKPGYTEVNLYEIIMNIFRIIVVPDNVKKQINIDPDLKFYSDSVFLKRVLSNLIVNAIQAMLDGGILTVSASRQQSGILITVEDTGVGIPEEIKTQIFSPMITTKPKGHGLGLAVVKRLVEALKGTITFKSQEKKGTKFLLKLPW